MAKAKYKITVSNMFESTHKFFKAKCRVSVNGIIDINDVNVCEGKDGLFMRMPQQQYKDKKGDTKYYPVVFPTDEKLMEDISVAVLTAYQNLDTGLPTE